MGRILKDILLLEVHDEEEVIPGVVFKLDMSLKTVGITIKIGATQSCKRKM